MSLVGEVPQRSSKSAGSGGGHETILIVGAGLEM